MAESRDQAAARERGCTCSEATVRLNASGDYVGHEANCPLHWQLKDETHAWEDEDNA